MFQTLTNAVRRMNVISCTAFVLTFHPHLASLDTGVTAKRATWVMASYAQVHVNL